MKRYSVLLEMFTGMATLTIIIIIALWVFHLNFLRSIEFIVGICIVLNAAIYIGYRARHPLYRSQGEVRDHAHGRENNSGGDSDRNKD